MDEVVGEVEDEALQEGEEVNNYIQKLFINFVNNLEIIKLMLHINFRTRGTRRGTRCSQIGSS